MEREGHPETPCMTKMSLITFSLLDIVFLAPVAVLTLLEIMKDYSNLHESNLMTSLNAEWRDYTQLLHTLTLSTLAVLSFVSACMGKVSKVQLYFTLELVAVLAGWGVVIYWVYTHYSTTFEKESQVYRLVNARTDNFGGLDVKHVTIGVYFLCFVLSLLYSQLKLTTVNMILRVRNCESDRFNIAYV